MTQEELKQIVTKGCSFLDSFLKEKGFNLVLEDIDKGSGGLFLRCKFVKADRTLQMSYRYSLGEVIYKIGNHELEHSNYMKFLGVKEKSKYPGFSDDPIDAFRHLAYDLKNFCADFIEGDGKNFMRYTLELKSNPNKFRGLNGI
jgi:hypothetical protein